MRYMLDTNICIYVIKHHPPQIISEFLCHNPEDFCISSVTYAELSYGVAKSRNTDRNRLALMLFLSQIEILPFDDRAAECCGEIHAELERRGMPIGPMDTMIAAHALSLGHTIVTNNTSEFCRVEGLKVINWM